MPYLLGSASQNSPGRLGRFQALNRSLTQSEAALYFKEGVAEADRNASQTPFYSSNFGGGSDNWANAENATVSGNVDGPGGQNDWLEIKSSISTNGQHRARGGVYLPAGKRTKIPLTYFIPNTNSACDGLRFYLSDGGSQAVGDIQAVVNQVTTIQLDVIPGVSSRLFLVMVDGTSNSFAALDDVVYIKGVDFVNIGQTARLTPADIQLTPGQWLESVNKAHVFLPNGARAQEPKRTGMLYGTNTFSSSAIGQPLQNVDWHIVPADAGVTLRMKATVSATFNIGDGVDVDRYAAAVTIGTDWTNITIANPASDGTNRKIVITPTASYSGVVTTAARVDLLN